MHISDCIVKEENRKEKKNIRILLPECVNIGYTVWDGEGTEDVNPTFGEIYDYITTHCLEDAKRAWGRNYEAAYEDALSKAEITVQTETAGYKYLCNFRDNIFEEIEDEDILSLAEEEKKREKFREEEAAARKVFNKKQIIRLVSMLLFEEVWLGIFLVDKELAKQIAIFPLFLFVLTGLVMIVDKIRFEDGFW